MSAKAYGLLGGKLGHSLSPRIHELFFAYTETEGSYGLLETELEALPQRMQQLQENYAGCNVTIPHKLHVLPYLAGITAEAEAIGAVNTIKFTDKGAFGYNTDYFGFGRMLEHNGISVTGKAVAVLGTGGAARAVLKYLADKNVGTVYLVTRNPSAVDGSLLAIAPMAKVCGYDALAGITGAVLVNCTPVGMYPKVDAAPVGAEISQCFDASVDLIYNPAATKFLQQAKDAGKQYVNGLFMLVAQAVAAQEIWQSAQYDSSLIVQIMKQLEQEL